MDAVPRTREREPGKGPPAQREDTSHTDTSAPPPRASHTAGSWGVSPSPQPLLPAFCCRPWNRESRADKLGGGCPGEEGQQGRGKLLLGGLG